MPTETPNYAAAWTAIKDDVYVAFSEGQSRSSSTDTALIEPGIRLLELSARYREARALHVEAVAAENAAYKANVKAPIKATDAARSAMDAAKQALLSAALDIT